MAPFFFLFCLCLVEPLSQEEHSYYKCGVFVRRTSGNPNSLPQRPNIGLLTREEMMIFRVRNFGGLFILMVQMVCIRISSCP